MKKLIKLYKEKLNSELIITDFKIPIATQNYQFEVEKSLISIVTNKSKLFLKNIISLRKNIEIGALEIYTPVDKLTILAGVVTDYDIYCILTKDLLLYVGTIECSEHLSPLVKFNFWNSNKSTILHIDDIKDCWKYSTDITLLYEDSLKWEILDYIQK